MTTPKRYHPARSPFISQPKQHKATLMSPQFKGGKGGTWNFRRTFKLGDHSSMTLSRKGQSFSTHFGSGLPSSSVGRKMSRSNTGLGGGYFYRKTRRK